MSTNTQVATIEFHGQPLITAKIDNEVFVAMKPVVEGIGLAWQSQHRKVISNPRFCITEMMMQMPGDDQSRSITLMPLRKLHGWLMTIHPGKIKDEIIRANVITYQEECDDVLWKYWSEGVAINPRAYCQNPGDSLTKEQADILRNLLSDGAKRLPKDKQGAAMMKGWSKLKAHFKCGYREIPQEEFTEAVSIIARHVSEGEYMEREELTAEEINQLAVKALTDTKFSLSFMQLENGQLIPQVFSHHKDAQTFVPHGLIRDIRDRTFKFMPDDLIPDLISAISHRLRTPAAA